MSTDEAPETTQDTPDTQDADTDWQKRYSDLQPEYTRTTQELAAERKVWEDEQAFLARVQEKYPHLITDGDNNEDDEDTDVYDDDPRFEKLTELEHKSQAYDEFMANQLQKEATEQFNSDLAELAGDRKIDKRARKWIFNETIELGDGKENLEKAYKAWAEFEDEVGEQYLERVKKTKRAPHVHANGKANETDKVDWSKLSHDEQAELMAEMARARLSQ